MELIYSQADFEYFSGDEILEKIEVCGRVCYKSESRITSDSANKFVRCLIERGHESVLEHVNLTAHIICDRGVSHELVRHRIAAFSQESTRYVNYKNCGMQFIIPSCFDKPDICFDGTYELQGYYQNGWYILHDGYSLEGNDYSSEFIDFLISLFLCERKYNSMIEEGLTPQQARAILPNALKTELYMTANLREWRHILKLRTDAAAHPDMRKVMRPLLYQLKSQLPDIVFDIQEESAADCKGE